jgi:hypothetical protein
MRSPCCLPICESICLSVCLYFPTNNIWTSWYTFVKLGKKTIPFMVTSTPYFNIVASTIPKWRTFKLLRWMQNLNQSTCDHEILYTDTPLKDEQLLTRPFLWKMKNANVEVGWNLKLVFLDMPTNCVWIIILFDEALKYSDCEILRLCWDKRRITLCRIM